MDTEPEENVMKPGANAERKIDGKFGAKRKTEPEEVTVVNTGAQTAKRKIGGHFGSAVGAATKKPRGGWREEMDEPEVGAEVQAPAGSSAALADDSDGSEEMMDPGTPLPSEDEAEVQPVAAAVEVPPAIDSTSGGDGAVPETDDGGKAVESAAPPAAEADPGRPAVVTSEAGATLSVDEAGVTVALELITGDKKSAIIQVLLRSGLSAGTEARLAKLCDGKVGDGKETTIGAQVEAIAAGALCIVGGHSALTVTRRLGDGKVGDGDLNSHADGDAKEAAPNEPSSSGSTAPVADSALGNSADGVKHSCAGLLTAPKEGPGLALTLGPQPALDATHTVIGPVIIGRRALRQIEALASLSGGFEPRQPLALRVVSREEQNGVANGTTKGSAGADGESAINGDVKQVDGESASLLEHPFLLLRRATAAVQEHCNKFPAASIPFCLDRSGKPPVSEILNDIELELDGRDAEVQELKAMSFTRVRAEGVAAIEIALHNVQEQLSRFTDLETALSHQREWQQERTRHLQRIVQKLR